VLIDSPRDASRVRAPPSHAVGGCIDSPFPDRSRRHGTRPATGDRSVAPIGCLLTPHRRARPELRNLAESIALDTPTNDEAAASVRPRRDALRRIEKERRRPRVVPPDIAKLRAALQQRPEQWKADLRAESRIARMVVLRRLVGPPTLWDESERPDFVKWQATPTTG
jgi:hypothetical protein